MKIIVLWGSIEIRPFWETTTCRFARFHGRTWIRAAAALPAAQGSTQGRDAWLNSDGEEHARSSQNDSELLSPAQSTLGWLDL